MHYRGRFAPSPTGLLHAGSLVAALASWLDARAHGGTWLVRIEDVDTPRCMPGADTQILQQLATCGLVPDEPPVWQSKRSTLYEQALNELIVQGAAYPCGCSRSDIERTLTALGRHKERHQELVYPGTCRTGLKGRSARALRCATTTPDGGDIVINWHDRQLGPQKQNLTQAVGDFVLKRADGLWSYQLAVVVDDAKQRITHVVRGEDLLDNTPRQIHLQRLLGKASPAYLHTPLVYAANGEKLSKQTGAPALDLRDPLAALRAAARTLDLPAATGTSMTDWLGSMVRSWQAQRGAESTRSTHAT